MVLNEQERKQVTSLLRENATRDNAYDYPDDSVRLIGEQIDHEQEVIKSALRSNNYWLNDTYGTCHLGAIFHPWKVRRLKSERYLLQRRNQELDQLWIREDEKLRKDAGVKWEDLNEIFQDLSYPSLAEFTTQIDHGYHRLDPRSKGFFLRVYGNTIMFPYPETEFFEATKYLGLQKNIVRQLIDPGSTGSPIAVYRLTVPYKHWLLAKQGVEDRTNTYQDDPDYKPAYYSGLFIPTKHEIIMMGL